MVIKYIGVVSPLYVLDYYSCMTIYSHSFRQVARWPSSIVPCVSKFFCVNVIDFSDLILLSELNSINRFFGCFSNKGSGFDAHVERNLI